MKSRSPTGSTTIESIANFLLKSENLDYLGITIVQTFDATLNTSIANLSPRMVTVWRLSYQRSQYLARRSSPVLAACIIHHFSTLKTGNNITKTDNSDDDKDQNNKGQRLFDSKQFTQQWSSAKDFIESKVNTINEKDESSPSNRKNESSSSNGLFGMVKSLIVGEGTGSTNDIVGSKDKAAEEYRAVEQSLRDIQSSLMGILSGSKSNQSAVEELVTKARTSSEQGDISDSVSLEELMNILRTVSDEMDKTFEKHLNGRNFPAIYPTNLFYFLDAQDEIKNFSWRRRKHRFCRGINFDDVDELNSYCRIAKIGYEDDMEKIKKDISEKFGYEVIYCQMDSLPGQPSHFLAIKKDQSAWSSSLDMLLCVRGTKTITDVITDLLADSVDYRDGKAHSGILQSGKHLAEKHLDTFQEFLKASGKKKIKLTLVGHSLGAGAASIAGIELHEKDDFEVQVIGFGCPALLSKELSKGAEGYITTVVDDNDCIPRMSLATMVNTVLDIGEYNWIPKARQDIEDLVDQVQEAMPGIISDGVKRKMLDMHNSLLSNIELPEPTDDRMEPDLFPRKHRMHSLIKCHSYHTSS